MAFLLHVSKPIEDIKVITVGIEIGGTVYGVPYELDVAVDPAIWIVDNEATITTDAPTLGTVLDAAEVAVILEEAEDAAVSQALGAVVNIADLFPNKPTRKAMRALVELIMDEINILRGQHGLAPRTMAQFLAAFKNKYQSL